jgi:hypothetical protein
MSVADTVNWINEHKRKTDAAQRWQSAYEQTKTCAKSVESMSGFAAATAYYNCRKGKKVAA